jgi:hypothetical protein
MLKLLRHLPRQKSVFSSDFKTSQKRNVKNWHIQKTTNPEIESESEILKNRLIKRKKD